MLSTKTEEAMLNNLRYYPGLRWYGMSAFGNWFAAKTAEDLVKVGVFAPKKCNR